MSVSANLGELNGKYRVLAELGQGGSANVWLTVARGPSGFSKLVVLKSMRRELKSEPELAQMFMNEARLAARLNHPNIVQTNEVFEHDGVPVMVMEYLDGQSVAATLARQRTSGGFPLSLQLRVLSETLAGLHAAHTLVDFDGTPLDVVHRDVSPHNLFTTYDGQTKVLDFGIAKLGRLGDTGESGVIRGKLHYMSPEQISGEGVDRRADIYAAGVLLWEMTAGRRMWSGVNEAVIMNRVLSNRFPRLLTVAPNAPPRLAEIIDMATAFAPSERYATAADFQLDVDEYLAATAPRLRTRDVGDAIARMFSDRRAERRQIVEWELLRVSEQSPEEYGRNRPLPLPKLETHAENATQMRRHQRRQLLKTGFPWLIAGLLGLVLAVLLFKLRGPTPSTLATTSPVANPSASEALTSPLHLRVTAFPVHAQLSLDGIALMGNPYLGSFERDGSPHVIVATAENYSPVRLEVVYSEDQDLVLMLEPALSLDGNNQANPMTPFSDGDTASVAPRRPYSPSREMSRP